MALIGQHGLHIRYVIDTHTHADHFSAARSWARSSGAKVVTHAESPATWHADLRLDDGDMLMVGDLRLQALHTPGHTRDSMCLLVGDRVFTGDTLLIGGTGRTDLPTGDPDQLLRQPVRQAAEAAAGDRWSIRRTTTKAAATRPSDRRSPTIRACRSATGPRSSR